MSRNVTRWLEQLGLGEYAAAFATHDIDEELLPELDQETLKEIGVVSTGHRLRILKAARALRPVSGDAGSPPEEESATAPAALARSEAERRQLTVLFCDLVGSTSLAGRLDVEDLRDVIRSYQDACAGAITRFEGYVARYVGDGLLVYFGFPKAHEDDAERAVRAALGVLAAMENLGARLGQRLEVRIGIATGRVVVGDIVGDGAAQEQAVVGETPNLAARLQGLARPNTIVIADGTRELMGEQFDLEDIGAHRLKGIPETVRAWRVIGECAVESRFGAAHPGRLTRFVGRDQEVELLLDRWRQARVGEGQLVLLSGEAGIGKSRITDTLRSRLTGEEYVRILYQCSPHHTNSPLYPAIQQLTFAADIRAEDAPDQKLDKLEALLRQSSATREMVALMAALLSIPVGDRYRLREMTPLEQKQKTLQALVEGFEGLARRQPVLFVFEDAHWIDPTTSEQMDLMLDRARTLPALVLVTHRPEFEAPWTSHSHCTVLTLNRLGRDACTALIADLTGGRELPGEVIEQIVSKTDGVPLFVEELTKTVLESGLLAPEGDHYALSGPLPPPAIPSTLHDSLMARLDRLEGVKEIGQIGAAIGREFSHALLEAVSPLHGRNLDEALARLIESEIVFRRGVTPDATYMFKHALIQDAAYEALLRSRRQQIHASIAGALESRFPERVRNEPELIAHHYTQAGLFEQAAPMWLEAGRRAVARSANYEARAHLEQGLEVLGRMPPDINASSLELDMQISLGSASIATSGYSAKETEEAYVRGRELLDDIGDDPRQFAVLHGLSMCYINQANFERNLEVAEEMLRRAEPKNDAIQRLVAHRVMAVTQNIMADFEDAREHAETAAQLYDPEQHHDSAHHYGHDQGVASDWHLAIALTFLGFLDAAEEVKARAFARARELEHANTSLYGSLYVAFTGLVKRDWRTAREVAADMIEDAGSRSMALWVVFGRHHLGSALAAQGESEAALDEIQRGRVEARRLNHSWLKPMTLRFEAQALADLGRLDEAYCRIDEALGLVDATGERWWEAELHRYQGELNELRNGPGDRSEASFERAIRVARSQKSRLFELRAVTSLGRLWHAQGKRDEARELIAPVYEWFTEGFGVVDLTEARSLLDQLS